MTNDKPKSSVIFLPKSQPGWREMRRALREGEDADGVDWDERAQRREQQRRAVRVIRNKATGVGDSPDDGAA